MALGNISLSDMPWLGKPADPAESFARGMAQGQSFASRKQDAAAKQQAMEQSAEMHPLKMADMASNTAYRDAITDYNVSSKDARIEGINLVNRARELQNNYNDQTMEDRVSLMGLRVRQGEDDLEHFRKLRPLQYEAQSLANTARGYDISRAAIQLADQSQRSAVNAQSLEKYQSEQGAVTEQLTLLQDLTEEQLANYVPPVSITHPAQRAKLTRYVAERRGTKQYEDYAYDAAQDRLDQTAINNQRRKEDLDLGQSYTGILNIRDPRSGLHLLREPNGELTHAGYQLRQEMIKSKPLWDQLTPAEQREIRGNRHSSNYQKPTGATSHGQYFSDYNGQTILNPDGREVAKQMLKARQSAAMEAQVGAMRDFGLIPTASKDGKISYELDPNAKARRDRLHEIADGIMEAKPETTPAEAYKQALVRMEVENVRVVSGFINRREAKNLGLEEGQVVLSKDANNQWQFGAVRGGELLPAHSRGQSHGTGANKADPANFTGPQTDASHGKVGEINPYTGRINEEGGPSPHEVLNNAQALHKRMKAQGASLELRRQITRVSIDPVNDLGWNTDDSEDAMADDVMQKSIDAIEGYQDSIFDITGETREYGFKTGRFTEYNVNQFVAELVNKPIENWPDRLYYRSETFDQDEPSSYTDLPKSLGDKKKLLGYLIRHRDWVALRNRMGEEMKGHKGVQSKWKAAQSLYSRESKNK